MEQVFISSLARGEMAAIRRAAIEAVESVEMRPVAFETGAPSDDSSRRTLLDRVAQSDALILLLGAEYGEPVARGVSPTEEEFDEARRAGVPVLALVQDVNREPEQAAFVDRVRGGWEEGKLTASFTGPGDVGLAVVRALYTWRNQRSSDRLPVARERALELARGHDQRGTTTGIARLRVAAVPVLDRVLVDAMALRDSSLADDVAGLARAARLIPQSMGLESEVGRDSIVLAASGNRASGPLGMTVGFDGAVVAEGPVGSDDMFFGGSQVVPDRVRSVLERSLTFATAVWNRIDSRDEVRQVVLACAVPEAEHKVYALAPVAGSMSMPMGMPAVLLVPDEPLHVRREDVASAQTVERLQAELRRAFEIAGAIHTGDSGRGGDTW